MKIYYIAVSSWDGRAYTFDYNEFFFSEQERDAAYEKLRHNADFDVCKGEEGMEQACNVMSIPRCAVKSIVYLDDTNAYNDPSKAVNPNR